MTTYTDFLARKARRVPAAGLPCDPADVHPRLHDWQRELTAEAVRRGRAALWWSTGLGKTSAQLEYARLSGKRSLIVAPLAVCHQTVDEAAKIDLQARYVRSGDDLGPGVYVTNYEMVGRFEPGDFDAVVIDEASCLKHHDAKIRRRLIEAFAPVPHRLVATATPAPNDPAELTGQAEFLGLMSRPEMLAAYFINDGKSGGKSWRLKGHAREPMFAWMAGWASALRTPADLGYPDEGYRLPPLHIHTHLIPTGTVRTEGALFEVPGAAALKGVTGRSAVRKATLQARCGFAVDLVRAEPDEPWLLWAGLNAEAEMLARELPGAVNVHGSMTPEEKAEALLAFARDEIRILITKPSIASFGMNWQHCARQAFVGLSDSFEAYFQCIRRSWRYGQTGDVHAHIVLTDIEAPIAENVHRKEREANALIDELVTAVNATKNRSAA